MLAPETQSGIVHIRANYCVSNITTIAHATLLSTNDHPLCVVITQVSKSRAKANHNTVAPAAHPISGAPPSIPPSSIVDGYFTIPLPVGIQSYMVITLYTPTIFFLLLINHSAGRGPINKVTHKLYRTPHKACTNESAKTTVGGTSPTNSSGKKHVTQCAPVERMPYMDCADRDLRVPMDFRQPRGTNVIRFHKLYLYMFWDSLWFTIANRRL